MGSPVTIQDGKIRVEVDVGPSVGKGALEASSATAYADINPSDIGASRVGISGGAGGATDISIGREGIKGESGINLGLGGDTSVKIDVQSNGDVSINGDVSGATPFGDVGIDVDIEKIGCTITVTKTLISPVKTFTVTETYTDPKCTPSPSPSPSPSSQGIGYPSDKLPELDPRCTYVFHVLVQLGQVEYFNFIRIGEFPAYAEIWENVVNKSGANSTYIESVYIDSSGNYRATVGGTEPINQAPAYKRITRWQLGGNICTPTVFTNTYMPQYQRNYPDAAFNIYPRLISCSYPKPWPEVPPGKLIEIPKWNSPPMAQDNCCNASTSMMRKIMKVLAIDKFPGQMPETILQKGKDSAQPAEIPIEDYVDLLLWIFKRDDERWGQWHIDIEVKDADKTKKGDQKKNITLPNLAEAIAEIEGQLLTLLINQQLLIKICMNTMIEGGLNKQETIKGLMATKAIINYLGFPAKEREEQMPLLFNPIDNHEKYDEILTPKKVGINTIHFEEANNFKSALLNLLQSAAIIRAVYFRRLDSTGGDKGVKKQILKQLKLLGYVSDGIDDFRQPDQSGQTGKPNENDKEWREFLDDVETGLTNKTGITDSQNPYGRTRDRRPLFKELKLTPKTQPKPKK